MNKKRLFELLGEPEEIKCKKCGQELFKALFGDDALYLKCTECEEIITVGSRGPMFIEDEEEEK